MKIARLCAAALAAVLSACATPPVSPYAGVAQDAAAFGSAEGRIRADVAWLADDAREGREAGAPGYDAAAGYVAARMAGIGLDAVGGRYAHPVPMVAARRRGEAAEALLIGADGAVSKLEYLDDYLIGRPMRAEQFAVTAPVAYAGYGIVLPDGRDDYAGIDVRGRIVAVFGGAPAALNSEERAHYGAITTKLKLAGSRGAAGLVILRTKSANERSPWSRFVSFPGSEAMTWVDDDGTPHVSTPLEAVAYFSDEGAAKLFEGEAATFADLSGAIESDAPAKPFLLSKSLRLAGASERREVSSANVLGFIRGADPAFRDEIVLITAHLDHVGVRPPREDDKGDGIHNGALDNAVGVATMLEAARSLKAGAPPRRTVIFAALTAEEKGLVGAEYLAERPPFGRARIVANVNLDMPILLYPFTDVVAFGAERSSLGKLVGAAAAASGVKLSPDPMPEEGIFTRSDHYAFVVAGVPAVLLMPGFANGGEAVFRDFLTMHYHRPTDDLSLPIDYNAARRFADLNAAIMRAVADAPSAPVWNSGDFFGELYGRK